MRRKPVLFVSATLTLAALVFTLVACQKESAGEVVAVGEVEVPSTQLTVPADEDMFTNRDYSTEYKDTPVVITLSGSTAVSDSANVTIDGGNITITQKGTYEFTGTLSDGMIIVDAADYKIQLVFNEANINSSNAAALYVAAADKVFITVLGNSSLSATGADSDIDGNNVDGAVFSKDDITFNGTASLAITSAQGHGIVGKDDVKITSGEYTITAAGHGIDANDSVRIAGGSITISATKDGIHVENEDDAELGYFYMADGIVDITSGRDGIDASASLQIKDGTVSIVSGGGSGYTTQSDSMKGLKSSANLVIYDGSITVSAADDAVHSNAGLQIDGGTLTLSSGDDGIHADGVLLINDGTISVTKSYEGIEGKSVTIKGGDISVYASDDGINAAGGNDSSAISGRPGQNSFSDDGSIFVTISDGTVYINASGDGIDSNGALYIAGGTIIVEGPTDSGNAALDFGDNSKAQITGGIFLALGSSGMAVNFNAASQGAALVNISQQAAGSQIRLCDSDGNVLLSYTATKRYSSVLVSTPSLTIDKTYTLYAGNQTKTISMTSLIYGGVGHQTGIGGMGIR